MIINKKYKHKLSDEIYECIDDLNYDDLVTIVKIGIGNIPIIIHKDSFGFYELVEEEYEPEPDIGNDF